VRPTTVLGHQAATGSRAGLMPKTWGQAAAREVVRSAPLASPQRGERPAHEVVLVDRPVVPQCRCPSSELEDGRDRCLALEQGVELPLGGRRRPPFEEVLDGCRGHPPGQDRSRRDLHPVPAGDEVISPALDRLERPDIRKLVLESARHREEDGELAPRPPLLQDASVTQPLFDERVELARVQ